MDDWQCISDNSIVDYLSLCFAINASIAFDRVQSIVRKRTFEDQEKQMALISVAAAESPCEIQGAAKRTLDEIQQSQKGFERYLENSNIRGKVYSVIGCSVCVMAVIISECPMVSGMRIINLWYLFPVPLFVCDILWGYVKWRLFLRKQTKKWSSYTKIRERLKAAESNLSLSGTEIASLQRRSDS